MSEQNKNGKQDNVLEKLVLLTAIIELTKALTELVKELM